MANVLTKKAGPLPVWAWGAIVAGGALAYKAFHGSGASATAGYTTDANGNVYDADGNLVASAPQPPSQVGLGDGGGGGVTTIPVDGGSGGTTDTSNADTLAAFTSLATGAFGTVGDIASGAVGALGDIGTEQAASLGAVAQELANSQSAVVGSLASPAVTSKTTVVASTPTPKPPRTVVSVKTLKNGAILTTYSDGHEVEQAPGKSPYVVKQ